MSLKLASQSLALLIAASLSKALPRAPLPAPGHDRGRRLLGFSGFAVVGLCLRGLNSYDSRFWMEGRGAQGIGLRFTANFGLVLGRQLSKVARKPTLKSQEPRTVTLPSQMLLNILNPRSNQTTKSITEKPKLRNSE